MAAADEDFSNNTCAMSTVPVCHCRTRRRSCCRWTCCRRRCATSASRRQSRGWSQIPESDPAAMSGTADSYLGVGPLVGRWCCGGTATGWHSRPAICWVTAILGSSTTTAVHSGPAQQIDSCRQVLRATSYTVECGGYCGMGLLIPRGAASSFYLRHALCSTQIAST